MQAQGFISGRVSCAESATIEISVETPDTSIQSFMQVNENQQFSFYVPVNGRVTITPRSDANPLNGVSTFDIALILLHIADVTPFDSPYKQIAADADDNGLLNEQDSVELRKLILGIYTSLPEDSYRFIPANYVFPDPTNPFSPPFPRSIVLDSVVGNVSGLNFIGVKVGDVNSSSTENCGENTVFNGNIWGEIIWDKDGDCLADSLEESLGRWPVVAENMQTGIKYTRLSRNDGLYHFSLPNGNYRVNITPPNGLLELCTDTVLQYVVTDTSNVVIRSLAQTKSVCAYPEVNISTPFLRRCFPNTYYISYANQGTAVLENAEVSIQFDSFFQVQSSSIPWSATNGNTYIFPVGDLEPNTHGQFTVGFLLDCDAEIGLTHCTQADIGPYAPCEYLSGWDGSRLQVEASCINGDVQFAITNLGADMASPVDYIVVEDIMIQMVNQGSIQLDSGETQVITIPANGSTWRIEVGQTPDNPYGQWTSTAIEGCGNNGTGSFSLGFINLFPLPDDPLWIDEDCVQNIGSFDPNDKQGFPLGVTQAHWVPRDQRMEYLIRFQNTGTDTAFTVMILDQLDPQFNAATIRPGVSSHAYRFELLPERKMQFIFPNIMLPDSNVNEPLSHGFVRFSVDPLPGLSNGTVIENNAAIYFDFNQPVFTNATFHTFGEQYLPIGIQEPAAGLLNVHIWPNPAQNQTTVDLLSFYPLQGTFRLFDALGKQVFVQSFDQNRFVVTTRLLAPGTYVYRIESLEGRILGWGKLSVSR